jgi:hypothetical protein
VEVMNRKQMSVLIIMAILVVTSLICTPIINFKPGTPYEEMDRVSSRLERIFWFYIPGSILVVGGICFYLLKKTKSMKRKLWDVDD